MLGELNEQQIRKTAIALGIPADFIRKDFFVTNAILALTQIEDEYFSLTFQGGTSLSKGHKVIHRLSEDVDFRIALKPNAVGLGKGIKRKKLRDFRYALIDALVQSGFQISKDDIQVYYEGRYTSIPATFEDSEKLLYLKPHVAIECFLGELLLPTHIQEITSLIKVTLGEECDHISFPVTCISLDETAAEKWVALTRRVAATAIKERRSDKHLIRHIYDLYQLCSNDLLTEKFYSILPFILEKEKAMYQSKNPEYVDDPYATAKIAIDMLASDQWQNHWNDFMMNMVYDKEKPSFFDAMIRLSKLSDAIY